MVTILIPIESTESFLGFKSWDELYNYAKHELNMMEAVIAIHKLTNELKIDTVCEFQFTNQYGIKSLLKLQVTNDK